MLITDGMFGRIIPARAGFTARTCAHCRTAQDHPRSRGVYRTDVRPLPDCSGSSPLARGLPGRARRCRRARGIIPARAGFTPWRRARSPPKRDHPRSRGVYRIPVRGDPIEEGSSPLARGLRRCRSRCSPGGRIIPARAGFTLTTIISTLMNVGSSPLARGLLLNALEFGGQIGIIPARAGFTRP